MEQVPKSVTPESIPQFEAESLRVPREENAHMRETVHHHEASFGEISWNARVLMRWMRLYHKKEVEIEEIEEGIYAMRVQEKLLDVPALPRGYSYSGGAARAALAHALGLPVFPPRDLDIVFTGPHEEEDPALSHELSQKYMPDDALHGHGVRRCEENYFTSRDFTLNEVIFDGERVFCTKQCILDTMRNIVRFSVNQKRESYHGAPFYLSPKLIAKALRFVALARTRGQEEARIADYDALAEIFIDEFHMSLHLDRAREQGYDVAHEYVRELVRRGSLPAEIGSVEEAFKYLLGKTNFIFRSALARDLEEEERFMREEGVWKEDNTPTSVVPFWKKV